MADGPSPDQRTEAWQACKDAVYEVLRVKWAIEFNQSDRVTRATMRPWDGPDVSDLLALTPDGLRERLASAEAQQKLTRLSYVRVDPALGAAGIDAVQGLVDCWEGRLELGELRSEHAATARKVEHAARPSEPLLRNLVALRASLELSEQRHSLLITRCEALMRIVTRLIDATGGHDRREQMRKEIPEGACSIDLLGFTEDPLGEDSTIARTFVKRYLVARLGYPAGDAENLCIRVTEVGPRPLLQEVGLRAAAQLRREVERVGGRGKTTEAPAVIQRTGTRLPIPEKVRHEVWRRDMGLCVDCGSRENLEFDHIIPVSKGGSNAARNIELRCESCNRSKGARI